MTPSLPSPIIALSPPSPTESSSQRYSQTRTVCLQDWSSKQRFAVHSHVFLSLPLPLPPIPTSEPLWAHADQANLGNPPGPNPETALLTIVSESPIPTFFFGSIPKPAKRHSPHLRSSKRPVFELKPKPRNDPRKKKKSVREEPKLLPKRCGCVSPDFPEGCPIRMCPMPQLEPSGHLSRTTASNKLNSACADQDLQVSLKSAPHASFSLHRPHPQQHITPLT